MYSFIPTSLTVSPISLTLVQKFDGLKKVNELLCYVFPFFKMMKRRWLKFSYIFSSLQ